MSDSYNKYKAFDFQNNQEWQTYFKNLTPTPPYNKVEKYKRKWYQSNVDKQFDLNYEESDTQANNSSSSSSQPNQQQQQYYEMPKPQPYNNNSLYILENLLKVAVFPSSIFAEPFIVKIFIVVSSILAVIRNKGMIKFSKEYLALVVTSEFFHNIIFTISIPHGRNSFVFYLPIYIHFLSGLCEFVQKYPNMPVLSNQAQFKQMVYFVKSNREFLILAKMKIEIYLFFYTIFGVFFGLSSFINVFLMFQFISMKTKVMRQMQIAQNEFKYSILNYTPGPLKGIVQKIITGYEKLLNLLTPSQ